jgi:hypothetical protein
MDDPIEEEVDETSVIVSGRDRQHGCYGILNALIHFTTTLTRV